MIYSFQPVADTSDLHVGFYLMCFIAGLVITCVLTFWKEGEIDNISLGFWTVLLSLLLIYSHHESYTDRHPLNEKLIGEFVGFHSEVRTERSGKSTVENHYVYVIYRVEGSNVLFRAAPGLTFPPRAVVYKNREHE